MKYELPVHLLLLWNACCIAKNVKFAPFQNWESFFLSEHAWQRSDGGDLHRGPAGLFQRRRQELLRRHERKAGIREGLRRPRRTLQAGGEEADGRKKVSFFHRASYIWGD